MIHPPYNITLTENEPMARHTSWRIGGPARYYAEVSGADQARALAVWAAAVGLPLAWVGGGTNLLVDDAGFPGVIARYRAQSWRIDEDGAAGLLWVEAGAPMAGTARRVSQMGWAGLEWAEGVPGTIGGAVFGNAGCYGGDIAGILQSATLLVGAAVEEWPLARMGYGYRTSALKGQGDRGTEGQGDREMRQGALHAPLVPVSASGASGPAPAPPLILAATLRLTPADPQALMAKIAGIAAERKRKTPVGSSCGSVFKNPPGQSAGQLIERAGLKGRRIGGAAISERHANYIVNVEGASGADILALVGLARAEVHRQFGVDLELEVRILPDTVTG